MTETTCSSSGNYPSRILEYGGVEVGTTCRRYTLNTMITHAELVNYTPKPEIAESYKHNITFLTDLYPKIMVAEIGLDRIILGELAGYLINSLKRVLSVNRKYNNSQEIKDVYDAITMVNICNQKPFFDKMKPLLEEKNPDGEYKYRVATVVSMFKGLEKENK